MGRERTYKYDIGKYAIVYMGDGIDSVGGTLTEVTRDELVLDLYDSLGAYSGIRHTVPWENVYRVMIMDSDAVEAIRALDDEEDYGPEPPKWVEEVLRAAMDAVGGGDDGTTV